MLSWIRLLLCILLCAGAQAQTRRALLVGIDHYAPSDAAPVAWKPTKLRPTPLTGTFQPVVWPKLNGAVNDMKSMHLMLLKRGFQEQNIIELVNEKATGDAILTTLKSHLIDQAKPGDSSLFYFAGHGARIKNPHANLPGDYDVAMVPYDAPTGVPGLRGKELARIYQQVPNGVSLTVIQDNCFSASGARGPAPPLLTRDAPDDSRVVDDPLTGPVPDQQENPVLVLAASQRDQKAEELADTDDPKATGDSGLPHGRFTFALLEAMNESLPDESVAVLFQRTRNLMHTDNTLQEPSMLGKGRGEKGLFGQKAVSPAAIVPMVQSINGFTIVLDHGQATGLREGCELIAGTSKEQSNPKIRLQITKLVGLDQAEATAMSGVRPEDIHRNDRFIVDKWTSFGGPALSVYVPAAAPPLEDLTAVAQQVKEIADSLKLTWITDPTQRVPEFSVRWNGHSWELRRAKGAATDLGAKPAERLAAVLKAPVKGEFFLELPPAAEWLPKGLKLGADTENAFVGVNSKSPASAQYMLAGAWTGDHLEYSWVAPNLTQEAVDQQLKQLNRGNVNVALALPLRTKPVKAAAQPPYALTDQALRLSKLRGWLQLDPPDEAKLPFPYHVALKNLQTGEYLASGTVVKGQKYDVLLKADPKTLDEFVERYKDSPHGLPASFVYMFVIDSQGRGQLVFPRLADNGVTNRLPIALATDGKISLKDEIPIYRGLEVDAPYGVDSYTLLTTAAALANPDVLNFDGVGASRGLGGDALSQLLDGVGSRGIHMPAPTDWSIERTFIHSVAK
ncbi:MAG TPA: caspase family protein [Candidatus Sulfopaludibacter sp.]|jgi:hypothetical protein|nr:caspase family protein [Candidatus Sulfopaludibacter sp.]